MRLHLETLGVEMRLQVEDPALAGRLARALGDLGDATGSASPDHHVTVRGEGPWRTTSQAGTTTADSPERALTQALTAVNHIVVTRTPLLAFHAAVVTRHGRALVLPARSGSGKSTLTACLLQQGWSYVSDEALALDWATGRLEAYPRPMALSPWSCAAAGGVTGLPGDGETVVTASHLGATVDASPGPVRHVVLLRRGTSSEATISPTDRNDGLHELLQRGFTHHVDGGTALRRLAELLGASAVVELSLGDPVDAATAVTTLVDAR